MTCHLFSAKPLPKPMMFYCQLDPKSKTFYEEGTNYNINGNTHTMFWECVSENLAYKEPSLFRPWHIIDTMASFTNTWHFQHVQNLESRFEYVLWINRPRGNIPLKSYKLIISPVVCPTIHNQTKMFICLWQNNENVIYVQKINNQLYKTWNWCHTLNM